MAVHTLIFTYPAMLNKTSPTASAKLDILSRRLDQAILL